MKVVTAKEMRALEQNIMQEIGIPGMVLMEHAGKSLATKCRDLMDKKDSCRRVWIFVGKGNNGGDGLVAARHLANHGIEIRILLLCDPRDLRGDAKQNYDIADKMLHENFVFLEDLDFDAIEGQIKERDLIIDAIYGTGFKGRAIGLDAKAIQLIEAHGGIVISADLPSGMEADSGAVNGPCVKADFTLTFGLPKLGLYQNPNQTHCGRIEVVDISLPKEMLESDQVKRRLMTKSWVTVRIPDRKRNSHKGDYGHVFLVGGSQGMTGALVLSCRAALAMGAGLVTAGVAASLHDIMETKLTEVMTKAFVESRPGDLSQAAGAAILDFSNRASAVVLGPGMGKHESGKELLNEILPQISTPMVIDADGLNLIAEILKDRKDFLRQMSGPLVLTPHPGEMARLTGLTLEEIELDRISIATQYAKAWGVVLVLKGAYTIIANEDGEILINTTGNAGMATGGSGDVLSGMIGSLLGQGMEAFEAAGMGVFLHGRSGDAAADEKGQAGLIAGDIIEQLPMIIRKTRKK